MFDTNNSLVHSLIYYVISIFLVSIASDAFDFHGKMFFFLQLPRQCIIFANQIKCCKLTASNGQTLSIWSFTWKWRSQIKTKQHSTTIQTLEILSAQRKQPTKWLCIQFVLPTTNYVNYKDGHAKPHLRSRPWAPFQKVLHRIAQIIANHYAVDRLHTFTKHSSRTSNRVIIAKVAYIWTRKRSETIINGCACTCSVSVSMLFFSLIIHNFCYAHFDFGMLSKCVPIEFVSMHKAKHMCYSHPDTLRRCLRFFYSSISFPHCYIHRGKNSNHCSFASIASRKSSTKTTKIYWNLCWFRMRN